MSQARTQITASWLSSLPSCSFTGPVPSAAKPHQPDFGMPKVK